MLAEPIAPTVDTLTWEEAITIGAAAWESAEESKWSLGDIGAIVAHKWQHDSVKKFANSIGMHDNPRRLYEYVQVAQHYPKSARARFPNTTWSAWRECSRHGLTLEQSLDALAQHGDKPVAAIREAILGKSPRPPKPTSVTFEAVVSDGLGTIVRLHVSDSDAFWDAVTAHPDAKITVTVEYTPARDGNA